VRSTLSAGTITVTASRPGLRSAKIQIVSRPINLKDGFWNVDLKGLLLDVKTGEAVTKTDVE
jgi:hypothetical protein